MRIVKGEPTKEEEEKEEKRKRKGLSINIGGGGGLFRMERWMKVFEDMLYLYD